MTNILFPDAICITPITIFLHPQKLYKFDQNTATPVFVNAQFFTIFHYLFFFLDMSVTSIRLFTETSTKETFETTIILISSHFCFFQFFADYYIFSRLCALVCALF